MKITTSAYNDMLKTVGSRPAESGGLLFGSRTDWVVTKFLYDKNAETTRSSYTFDVGYLNPMMEKLADEGLQLLGFFHSHPSGAKQLSEPDRIYFGRQFKNIPVDKFYVPLMFPAVDGTYDFIPYVFHKDGRVEEATLELVPDDYQKYVTPVEAEITTEDVTASTVEIEDEVEIVTTSNDEIETETATIPSFSFSNYHRILWSVFYTGLLVFSLWVLFFFYKYMSNILNSMI